MPLTIDHLMQIITVHFIAAGLAMDAFAVSVISGAAFKELNIRHALRMAFFFGAFQAAMPLLGYAAGISFVQYIEPYDHWLAFALLATIGGKMVYEGLKMPEVEKKLSDPRNVVILLALSIATSIDALAVGFTLTLVTDYIFRAVATIGVITFLISYAGYQLGKRFGHFFENKIEILGGLILIAIGLKILITSLISNTN